MTKETQSFSMTEFQVMQWSQEKGILKYGTPLGQATKTLEEAQELIDAIKANDIAGVADAIGDVLVTLVNVAALTDLDVRKCFYEAYLQIKDRKGYMNEQGIFVKQA
jgi:NTP pyrophosphatase (non-canonical NTP hydrolase)